MKHVLARLWKSPLLTLLITLNCLVVTSACEVSQRSSSQTVSSGNPITRAWTDEEIDYFEEIAFGAEYGDSVPNIVKWVNDVRIKVIGRPTDEDRATLNQVIKELNELVQGITITLNSSNNNVEMYFVPESDFSRYESNYRPVNYGFFWYWWNRNYEIDRARVLISSTKLTQRQRSHIIREEVTQMLGMAQDSYRYPESIFYQGWTETVNYTELDKAVIRMLYQPAIRPGMTQESVIELLKSQ